MCVEQIEQSQLFFPGVWKLRKEGGTNEDTGLPPSGASQHPSQFRQTDALGAQRNPRHAGLRETQQKEAHAQIQINNEQILFSF